MSRQRLFILMVICVFLLSACGSSQQAERQVVPFSFTNQNGESFHSSELDGSVWIASFIFANCETVCPPMMMDMASLQDKMAEEGLHVQFVSFTVDPQEDPPEVLKEYIQEFTDNESNWHLLTGYTQNEIEEFARKYFQTIVQKPDDSTQVIHGTNFYVVDDEGFVLHEYNYTDESHMDEMIKDIKAIAP